MSFLALSTHVPAREGLGYYFRAISRTGASVSRRISSTSRFLSRNRRRRRLLVSPSTPLRKDTMKRFAPRTLAVLLLMLGACSPIPASSPASGNGGKKADTAAGVGGNTA